MYIIKNAFRCIARARGRSILIGIIVLVIAVSACLGLSIRSAAESARESALDGLSVTASISFDRRGAMGNFEQGDKGGFDRDEFKGMMGSASALTLEEYQKYASAPSVKDFYYTMTVGFNGSDTLAAIENEGSSAEIGGRGPGGMQGMGSQGELTVTGFSGDNAMTDFISGSAVIESGQVFEEGTDRYDAVISSELATYNGLSVGSTFEVTNPSLESEQYTLTVVGIYSSPEANEFSFSMGGMSDPANSIYMSYTALKSIVDSSKANASTLTNGNGREYSSAVSGNLSAVYSLATVDDYYAFESEVREMGLDESYTVYSSDLNAYENSLLPLDSLSRIAGYFLIVILVIGALILVVLNIFNIRERKYEIGVLTAMGMKKWKVAAQFLTEIFAITLACVIIGIGVGAVSSVPVTNTLLEAQAEAQSDSRDQLEKGFGRENGSMPEMPSGTEQGGNIPEKPSGDRGGFGGFMGEASSYITKINSAMDLSVALQMLGIALLLTAVSGAAGVLFVMRYEPLKILASRD